MRASIDSGSLRTADVSRVGEEFLFALRLLCGPSAR